ncbi:hypothetical protein AAFN88_16710 [Pelagibius sp. CAU 1746]|uniref:hypothetical protein n=1 Tax=Pelagibius sp. CAU 1746 TaxID=3140370 RepID=UPI00325C1661
MKSEHFEALINFISEEINFEEFLDRYPVDPRKDEDHVYDLLRSGIEKRDSDEVEAALIVGHRFDKFTSNCVPLLNELITADWHISHEDIAEALRVLRDPRSTDALYEAALLQFDYMGGDENALGKKCCWALGAIDTADAEEKLYRLAHSVNIAIAEAARYELGRKGSST